MRQRKLVPTQLKRPSAMRTIMVQPSADYVANEVRIPAPSLFGRSASSVDAAVEVKALPMGLHGSRTL
jgi:hypothetical protein